MARSVTYGTGTTITIYASKSGSPTYITTFGGACAGQGGAGSANVCRLTVNTDMTVSASF